MPALFTECGQCGRELSIATAYRGRALLCPACGHRFAAPSPGAAADDDGPALVLPAPRSAWDGLDEKPRRRKQLAPHRAGSVLALGILGLLLSCWSIAGWTFGGLALSMGGHDLGEMEAGRMDKSGKSATAAGHACGMLAIVFATIVFLAQCAIRFAALLNKN
jgi:hypothetical protein